VKFLIRLPILEERSEFGVMKQPLLVTTFDVWQPHQPSNSSDDLIAAAIDAGLMPPSTYYRRRLPVDFDLAPQFVIAAIAELNPSHILCLGMAETLMYLELESNGCIQGDALYTPFDLELLTQPLSMTQISHDAGQFVCNHLYYSVLNYIQRHRLPCQCLFIHVPLLQSHTLSPILNDFATILRTIQEEGQDFPRLFTCETV
jgi:pyroglutamyl-peptidase